MPYKLMRAFGAVSAGIVPPGSPLSVITNTGGGGFPTLDIAFAGDGTYYVAVPHRHVVLRVDSRNDNCTVFAGIFGDPGFLGDGGQASLAKLDLPSGVAVDASGNVYIAEYTNNRVRKVSTSGVITTYMGTGVSGTGGDGGLAVDAQLNQPVGVAVSPIDGIVLVVCYGSTGGSRIRRVDPGTGLVSSPFSGSADQVTSRAVVFDSQDNAYFINSTGVNTKVSKIDSSGVLTSAWFSRSTTCSGIGIGPDDVLHIIDVQNSSSVATINTVGSPVETPLTGNSSTAVSHNAAFPADGSDSALTAVPFAIARHRMHVDEGGAIWICTGSYVYKHVPTLTGLETFTNPVLVKTNSPGFDDANTIAMLETMLTGASDINQTGARPNVNLRNYHGGVDHLWLVGSSYSNTDMAQLEAPSGALRNAFTQALMGLMDANFQIRGGGDGTAFGPGAPRIQVKNKTGTYLVERWLNGTEINDYGIVLNLVVAGKLLICVCGIRDISTKAAAFVAASSQDVAYSALFASSNALLVHCRYQNTVTAPADFNPNTTNCRAMRLMDVVSAQPIAP